MTTKCRFCDYHKDTPLDLDLLKRLSEVDLPQEDWFLFMHRLVQKSGTKDWNGVKVHMGRMHKDHNYYGIWPNHELTDEEQAILHAYKATRA